MRYFLMIFWFGLGSLYAQTGRVAFSRDIPEFEIEATLRPDTVVSSPEWMIRDFIFQGNDLLILTWNKNPDKCYLRRIFEGEAEIASHAVDDIPLGFFEDVFGQIFLEAKDHTYLIPAGKGIQLNKVDESTYYQLIRPTVAKSDSAFFASTWHPERPEFEYLRKLNGVENVDTIRSIRDPHLYDLYYSEYRFLPFQTQCAIKRACRETGESKYDMAARVSGFTKSLWWRSLYSPLLHRHDSIFLVDHYVDSLFVYDEQGNRARASATSFHKSKGYKKEILHDKFTGTWYARYLVNGVTRLQQLDDQGQAINKFIPLSYRYVEKVRLHQGKVYYLYRPFESLQNAFLYSEVLPARLTMAAN